MNETHGIFICPNCKYNGIICGNYTFSNQEELKIWLSREEYVNNKLERKWVFYEGHRNKGKKWICCSFFGESGGCNRKILSNLLKCICHWGNQKPDCCALFIFPILWAIAFLFYILIFIWIDIINYCCDSKSKYYFVGHPSSDFSDVVDKKEIWAFGFLEEEWKKRKPWSCKKCKYKSDDFTYFIPKSIDLDTTSEKINLDDFIMSALFNSADGQINYSIPCKKTDVFSEIEKKLYNEYPEYKNKKCYFIQSGNIIDKTMTLENNGIQPGYPIILNIEE